MAFAPVISLGTMTTRALDNGDSGAVYGPYTLTQADAPSSGKILLHGVALYLAEPLHRVLSALLLRRGANLPESELRRACGLPVGDDGAVAVVANDRATEATAATAIEASTEAAATAAATAAGASAEAATVIAADASADASLAISAEDDNDPLPDWLAELNLALAALPDGAGYVIHTPGLGYALLLPGAVVQPAIHAPLPVRDTAVLGREAMLLRVASLLPQQRLVSIIGAGGMGKTTVALALARRAEASGTYADGVRFFDLAPLVDARLLPGTVALALGLALAPHQAQAGVAAYLRDKRMLFVFDSCEHQLGDIARYADALLSAVPAGALQLLVTSRAPLGIAGECLQRIAPMRLPFGSENIRAAEAMLYPGVRLFVERAAASAGLPDATLRDVDAPLVCQLCQRLDGIALAIELVAARVPQLGLAALATQTAERLLGAAGKRRTAVARHRTLSLMLDWSYDLLGAAERMALARLSVLRGVFTLEAAQMVAGGADADSVAVHASVQQLIAHSLLARAVGREGGEQGAAHHERYRLLDTTRAYASEKLRLSGEADTARSSHALFLRRLLERAEVEWLFMTRPAWLERYAPWLEDLRAAIEWGLGAAGVDASGVAPTVALGIELSIASFPLACQASLVSEFAGYVARGLAALDQIDAANQQPDAVHWRWRVRLTTWLGYSVQLVPADEAVLAGSLERALAIANTHGGPEDQIAPLIVHWSSAFQLADYAAAAHWAASITARAAACREASLLYVGQRAQAQALHFLGRHAAAQALAHSVITHEDLRVPLTCNPAQIDVRVSIRIVLSRILWLQGHAEQAATVVEQCLDYAVADTAMALCQALSMSAIPLALWQGETARAAALTERLHAHASRHFMGYWLGWAERYRLLLAGHPDMGLPTPEPVGVPESSASIVSYVKVHDHLCTFDRRCLQPLTLQRVETGLVGWCAPEALRASAENMRATQPQAALALLQRAAALAHAQGALAWELRCAISLAQLHAQLGQADAGRAHLQAVLGRFTEGHGGADQRQARALLAAS